MKVMTEDELKAFADEIRRECAGECNWREIEDLDDTLWTTSCGGEWYFEPGDPKESGYTYCPKCGKRIKFAAITGKEAVE